ncbi:MAG: glycosyltransferase [Micrococcales bacterium]|nr:glycosyltransferase [Micrococcales bacterium]
MRRDDEDEPVSPEPAGAEPVDAGPTGSRLVDAGPADLEPITLVVAVVTYRRPRSLAVALAGVRAQDVPDGVEVDLVVVDNDPERSAEPVADAAGARYASEPRPGLAAVRNAALDAAGGATLLQLIDDDEEPTEGWLLAMVRCWRTHGSAAVAGPLVRLLPEDTAPWVVASGFFDTPSHADGALRHGASTSNLLLDLAQVRRAGVRFDQRFAFSGGEDTMFTHELVLEGGEIRWCADGVVVESQPEERATRAWVLARARRTANSWARVHLALTVVGPARLVRRVWLTAHAAVIAGRGLRDVLRGRARGSLPVTARGEVALAQARGALAGAWGRTLDEYRRP